MLVQLAYAVSHCGLCCHTSWKAAVQMIHALAYNDSILLMLIVVGLQELCVFAPALNTCKHGVGSPSSTLNVHA